MSRTPSQYVEVTVAFAPVAMPPILLHVAYYCVANTIISLAIHEHKKRLQFLGLPMTGPDAVREGTEDYVLLFADRMQRSLISDDPRLIRLVLDKTDRAKRHEALLREQEEMDRASTELVEERRRWYSRTADTIAEDVRAARERQIWSIKEQMAEQKARSRTRQENLRKLHSASQPPP
jgi:hypothetical protein